MPKKTKILIVTDSPRLPTGMAETTRLIFGGLLDRYPGQYELHQIGLFDCYGLCEPQWAVYPTRKKKREDGTTVFCPEDAYGQETFPLVLQEVRPDIVFAFNDPQNVVHLVADRAARRHKLVLYLNFDGLPLAPVDAPAASKADVIVTMSEFSTKVALSWLPEAARGKVLTIYSPADLDRFRPLADGERQRLRHEMLPSWIPAGAFLLGWVGRNQWRKQVWLPYKIIQLLRAGAYQVCADCGSVALEHWAARLPKAVSDAIGGWGLKRAEQDRLCPDCRSPRLRKAEPLSDIFLWMHTPDEPLAIWPRQLLESQFGVQAGRDLHYTQGHGHKACLLPAAMPDLYHAWDCLLYLSGGEGFGIPAWEAMCSGLPAIYTNYSSHAEFLGKAEAGLPVGGMLQPEGGSGVWRLIADPSQAVAAVLKLYGDRALGSRLGLNGRRFAQQFTREAQAERWHGIFQQPLARAAS